MKQCFCLTKEEKALGLNPDWVVYAKASPELKAVLEKAIEAGWSQELDADAEDWDDDTSRVWGEKIWGGCVYRVHPDTPVAEETKPSVRAELKWVDSGTPVYGVTLKLSGFWTAAVLCCLKGFLEYEYPDGSRSMDFTRSKGLPVAAWFEEEPA